MQIVDGPAALGYIFSVATPPMVNPTWENYYLPLLVIYSKCLYLAYITLVPGAANARITDVPIMSCVMYIRPQTEPPHSFMFGSTWTSTDYDSDAAVLEMERRRMLDRWRRRELLEQALTHVPLQQGEAMPIVPPFDPEYWKELCWIFYRDFRGRKQPAQVPVIQKNAAANATETLRAATVATLKAAQPGLPDPKMIDVNQLANNFRTKNDLQTCVLNLLHLRFRAHYDRNSNQVLEAYQALIKYYLTPHMFPADPTGNIISNAEVPLPPAQLVQLNQTVATLWAAPGTADKALDKLDVLYDEQTQGGHPPTRPYGRCAETYCVVCML
jgi:hypothetical protein